MKKEYKLEITMTWDDTEDANCPFYDFKFNNEWFNIISKKGLEYTLNEISNDITNIIIREKAIKKMTGMED